MHRQPDVPEWARGGEGGFNLPHLRRLVEAVVKDGEPAPWHPLRTKRDHAAYIAEARRRFWDARHQSRGARRAPCPATGLTASEVDEWLATLPRAPLAGEAPAK